MKCWLLGLRALSHLVKKFEFLGKLDDSPKKGGGGGGYLGNSRVISKGLLESRPLCGES